MSIPNPQPTSGYIYEVGSAPGNVAFVAPLITNLVDFPSSLSGAAFAPLVVNGGATGIALQLNDSLAKQMNTNTTATISNGASGEVLWTTQTAGSLVYVGATGDIVIPQTGWYDLSASCCFTTGGVTGATPYSWMEIAITNGSGVVTTSLVASDFYAIQCPQVHCVAKLTAGQTVGVIVHNLSGGNLVFGGLRVSQFSVKLIS